MASRLPLYKIAPNVGTYSITLPSGAVTVVAADAALWSMRWTSLALSAFIHKVQVIAILTTAFGTAQDVSFGLYKATGFTASDSGGTAATLTGESGKLDSRFPTLQGVATGDLRIASTGALTGGTRTLNAHPLVVKGGMFGNAIGNPMFDTQPWLFGDVDSRAALILRKDEGLVLNNLVLMGATGVMTIRVTVEWSEVQSTLV